MNVIFVIALAWQRWATRRMLEAVDTSNYEYGMELVHCEQDAA